MFYISVLPCLFPFFVASKFLIKLDSLNNVEKIFLPLTKRYANTEKSAFVFFISLLSGFPVGVATACQLYSEEKIDKSDCENLSILCNFAGPIFVLGTIGNFFESQKIAIILYVSSLFGALTNALFFCKKSSFENKKPQTIIKTNNSNIFNECINTSIGNIFFVGATITIFNLISKMIFNLLPPLPIELQALLQGILEITTGSKAASQLNNKYLAIVMTAGFLGFGGICIFVQTAIFWQKAKLKPSSFLIKKATQAVASMFYCVILLAIFKI